MSYAKFPFSPRRWASRLKALSLELEAPGQARARELAQRIDACLEVPRDIFARHCPRLCPSCSRPCCVRISRRGLIDTSDLILMAALSPRGLPYPRARLRGCPFLEKDGCALPWNARPYACLHYVCGHLKRVMTHAEARDVDRSLVEVARLRSDLVGAYAAGRGREPKA